MRAVRRLMVGGVVVGLSVLGVAPAAQATAIPADCEVTAPSLDRLSLTCTGRPAGQTWRLRITCYPFGRMIVRSGNGVVGNGTSTASCGPGLEAFDPWFVAW